MARARLAAGRLAVAAAKSADLLRGAALQEEDCRQQVDIVLQALLAEEELLRAVDVATDQLPAALMVCQHLAREVLQHVGCHASHVRFPESASGPNVMA